jgi:hypothetical protein
MHQLIKNDSNHNGIKRTVIRESHYADQLRVMAALRGAWAQDGVWYTVELKK